MPVRIETITMDCRDERTLSAFWTAALGYEVAVDQPGDWVVLRDPKRVLLRAAAMGTPATEAERITVGGTVSRFCHRLSCHCAVWQASS